MHKMVFQYFLGRCVRVYVCVCVCARMPVCVCTLVHVHACAHMYMHACISECMCGCMHVWVCVTEFLSKLLFWNLMIICSILWLLFKLFLSTEDTPAEKLPREKRDQLGSTDDTRELFQPLRIHIHYSLGASLDSDTKEMLRMAVKKSVQKISTVLSGMCADF